MARGTGGMPKTTKASSKRAADAPKISVRVCGAKKTPSEVHDDAAASKKPTKGAATKKKPSLKSSSTLADSSLITAVNGNYCSWNIFSACKHPELPFQECQFHGCQNTTHHLCQLKWKEDNNVPEGPVVKYCPWHDEEAKKFRASAAASATATPATTTVATATMATTTTATTRTTTNFSTAAGTSSLIVMTGISGLGSAVLAATAPQTITTADTASLELIVPTLPVLPLTSRKYQCDWAEYLATSGGCRLPIVRPRQCLVQGCTRLVHLQCQRMWEDLNCFIGIFPDNEDKQNSHYCVEHHPSAKELLMIPSEDMNDIIDEINNNNDQTEAKEDDDKEAEASSDDSVDDDYYDLTEVGNCDSSNEEGDKIDEQYEYLEEVREERLEHLHSNYSIGDESNKAELFTECSGDIAEGDTEPHHWLPRYGAPIDGAPKGWVPPGPPEDFRYTAKYDAPELEEIDNPGNWNLYSFAPKFDKKKRYIGHFTPANAQVVEANANGKRVVNGWDFYYRGWKPNAVDEKNYVRSGAVKGNLKPDSRRGILDMERLRKHGMTKERVMNDPMFFFQLLFPICDPTESGIEGDQRMPYFTHVTMCTKGYSGYEGGGSDSGGHVFHRVTEAEMVHYTAVPIHHGALEGKPGSIYKRWDSKDRRYDGFIDGSITKSRWKAVKRYFKLNNNTMAETDKNSPSYDPCEKYDHIYKCLVHNINYFTLRPDQDATIDETTWGFGGYSGECGQRLINKPVSKGGQVVMLFDTHCRYPRAYEHQHNYHPKVPGFNAKGPTEMMRLVSKVDGLMKVGTVLYKHPSGNKRKDRVLQTRALYTKQPHLTADNFFSSDALLDKLGEKGYGVTLTCRRDRIPDGLKDYVHIEKGLGKDPRARVMRFEWPIVAIKQCSAGVSTDKKSNTKTLVSFQSTGSTYIVGVNNLPGVSLYVSEKTRGRSNEKRKWGVEQNEARDVYLHTYMAVDQADHMTPQ